MPEFPAVPIKPAVCSYLSISKNNIQTARQTTALNDVPGLNAEGYNIYATPKIRDIWLRHILLHQYTK